MNGHTQRMLLVVAMTAAVRGGFSPASEYEVLRAYRHLLDGVVDSADITPLLEALYTVETEVPGVSTGELASIRHSLETRLRMEEELCESEQKKS